MPACVISIWRGDNPPDPRGGGGERGGRSIGQGGFIPADAAS